MARREKPGGYCGIQHAVTLQGPDGGCAAGKLGRVQRCVGCKRDSTG